LTPSDQVLLTAVSRGDKAAFQQLYERFSARVYSTALSYAQQEQEAEEIVQDVFVNIFRKAHQFQGKSAVSTWIYRIAVNASLNHIQSKKRHFLLRAFESTEQSTKHPIHQQESFYHPGIALENKENAQLLYGVIQQLPKRQKTAFILSFIEELPRQEVADIMETSLKSIESLLQRSKKNLRRQLKNRYPNRGKRKK
jgi:RNA polymerase sigma-70 factor (ECF subfamily)